MPPLPPAGPVLKVELEWKLGEDLTAIDRFFLHYTGGPPSGPDCVTIATAIYTAAVSRLLPLLQTSSTLEGVVVTDLSSLSGHQGSHIAASNGSRTGSMPANAAVLMNMHLTRRYRGGKPRTYWPFGVSSDLADPQTWSTGALTAFDTGIFGFFSDMVSIVAGTTNVDNWANVSYYSGFTAVQNPITGRWKNVSKARTTPVVDIVVNATINPNVATQRRRTLIRHG